MPNPQCLEKKCLYMAQSCRVLAPYSLGHRFKSTQCLTKQKTWLCHRASHWQPFLMNSWSEIVKRLHSSILISNHIHLKVPCIVKIRGKNLTMDWIYSNFAGNMSENANKHTTLTVHQFCLLNTNTRELILLYIWSVWWLQLKILFILS